MHVCSEFQNLKKDEKEYLSLKDYCYFLDIFITINNNPMTDIIRVVSTGI